jgi:hypothetical protein
VLAELVGFEVHVRLEYHKLLLQALPVIADEVILLEVRLQSIVVQVVMRLPRVPSVTNETSLVLAAAVLVQLVVVVKPLSTESAERMTLEPGSNPLLVLIAVPHVLLQLLFGVHVMLVGKDLLVPSAEVAHLLVVDGADMAMQVWPAQAGKVAGRVRAVIPEKENSVSDNILAGVFDPDVNVRRSEVVVGIFLEAFCLVIGEDNEGSKRLQYPSAPGLCYCNSRGALTLQ